MIRAAAALALLLALPGCHVLIGAGGALLLTTEIAEDGLDAIKSGIQAVKSAVKENVPVVGPAVKVSPPAP